MKNNYQIKRNNKNIPFSLRIYKKLCIFSEIIIPFSISKKKEKEVEEWNKKIEIYIKPKGVVNFSYFLFGIIIIFSLFVLKNMNSILLFLLLIIVGFLIKNHTLNIPKNYYKQFLLDKYNERIILFFYIISYLRHTNSLEEAIKFSFNELKNFPNEYFILSNKEDKINYKKIIISYFKKLNDNNYLNIFYKIENASYETDFYKRNSYLDNIINDITEIEKEKLINSKEKIKTATKLINIIIYFSIIILLFLFFLSISFDITFQYLIILYIIIIPVLLFFFIKNKMYKINYSIPLYNLDFNYNMEEEINKKYPSKILSFFLILLITLFIGTLPLTINKINPNFDVSIYISFSYIEDTIIEYHKNDNAIIYFLDYQPYESKIFKTGNPELKIGPYGVISLLFSLIIIIGICISYIIYYNNNYKVINNIKENYKRYNENLSLFLIDLSNSLKKKEIYITS
jgi:hypothetical protein